MTPKQFGDRLRELLASDRAYAILDAYPEIAGSTWTSGACWPLATVLVRVVPGTKMMAIVPKGSLRVQHAVVAWRGGYLDADGWSKKQQLLKRWREEELVHQPRLVPFEDAHVSGGMVCPVGIVEELSQFLRVGLGKQNPWEHIGGGCLVGEYAEGRKYPCDDDFEDTKTGEMINVQTTWCGHQNLPTRYGGKVGSLKEIEGFRGVKKGSVHQVRPPKSKNPCKLVSELEPGDRVQTAKGAFCVRRAASFGKRNMWRVSFEDSNEVFIASGDLPIETVKENPRRRGKLPMQTIDPYKQLKAPLDGDGRVYIVLDGDPTHVLLRKGQVPMDVVKQVLKRWVGPDMMLRSATSTSPTIAAFMVEWVQKGVREEAPVEVWLELKRTKNPRKRSGKTRAQKLEESSREVLRQIMGGPRTKKEIQDDYAWQLREAQALARKLGVRLTAADKAHLMEGAEYGQTMEFIEVKAWLRERAAAKKSKRKKNPKVTNVGALVRKALQ